MASAPSLSSSPSAPAPLTPPHHLNSTPLLTRAVPLALLSRLMWRQRWLVWGWGKKSWQLIL